MGDEVSGPIDRVPCEREVRLRRSARTWRGVVHRRGLHLLWLPLQYLSIGNGPGFQQHEHGPDSKHRVPDLAFKYRLRRLRCDRPLHRIKLLPECAAARRENADTRHENRNCMVELHSGILQGTNPILNKDLRSMFKQCKESVSR